MAPCNKEAVFGYLLLGMAFFTAMWAVITFNKFIRFRNRLREAWSGIEVQLKRRHDLIPSLVNCVKEYQKHESELLIALAERRTAAQEAHNLETQNKSEAKLGRGLGRVLALSENYPELLASEKFQSLAKELVETEDTLQYARRYYNGSARDLNNLTQSFPSLIIARLFGFEGTPFFEVSNELERMAPKLNQQFHS